MRCASARRLLHQRGDFYLYNAGETTLRDLVDKLIGRTPFKDVSPVDAFCGMGDTWL
jgi:hypothetical protein